MTEITLAPRWFDALADGTKRVVGVPATLAWRSVEEGHTVKVVDGTGRVLEREVKAIEDFTTMAVFLCAVGVENVFPGLSIAEAFDVCTQNGRDLWAHDTVIAFGL